MGFVIIFGATAVFFIFVWLFISTIYYTVVAIFKKDFRRVALNVILFIGLSLAAYVLVNYVINFLSGMIS